MTEPTEARPARHAIHPPMTRPPPGQAAAALLCAYYPQQLLPGLAAIIEFRRRFGIDTEAPATVLVWSDPGVGAAFLAQRRQAFERLLQAFPWTTLVFPTPEDIRANLSPNARVPAKARHLRERFGGGAFAAVVYAHDIGSDYLAQSAMQAFPDARRVCYGDALGIVYSNDYYTRLTYPLGTPAQALAHPRRTLTHLLWRGLRHFRLPPRRKRLDADYAALILPCDPGEDFLPGKVLIDIGRDTLDQVTDRLARSAEPGRDTAAAAGKHLMLLGSFSESGFTSEEDEIGLYLQAARAHVPADGTLILKAHPASYGEKVRNIAAALGAHCRVEPAGADAMPIEVLRSLARCRSVISFSYSSVSLHYLHGSQVIHAMTPDLIDRYFPPHIRRWMHESNDLYLDQLAKASRLRRQQLGEDIAAAAPASPLSRLPGATAAGR